MKNLALLSIELSDELKSFIRWFKINYEWFVPCIALAIALFFVLNYIFTKRASRKASETKIMCNGIIEREGMKTFRKNIPVVINKETGMYYFKDNHRNWHKLRKIHRDEINKSMNDKQGPSFHLPVKKIPSHKRKKIIPQEQN